jgi:hypothetical protein
MDAGTLNSRKIKNINKLLLIIFIMTSATIAPKIKKKKFRLFSFFVSRWRDFEVFKFFLKNVDF